MDILLLPKHMIAAAVAGIGGVVMIELIYIPFFLITVFTLIILMLQLSIVLPSVMGIIALIFCLLCACISIYTFIHADGVVSGLFQEAERRRLLGKPNPENARVC
jgi:hypothetical protein